MNLILKISVDNAAFDSDAEAELRRVFEQAENWAGAWMRVAKKTDFGFSRTLTDSNGNSIGEVELTARP